VILTSGPTEVPVLRVPPLRASKCTAQRGLSNSADRRLRLWTIVNGERRQDGHTRHMVFPVRTLVAYVSRFMSLQPGDLISTGTPAGVGHGAKPPRYLAPGDVVEMGIDRLGVQRHVVAEWTPVSSPRRGVTVRGSARLPHR
jgi:hypothetical protein